MTEALQLEMKPTYQPHDVMADRLAALEQENRQLRETNMRLQQENDRLDSQLANIVYRAHGRRMRMANSGNSGSAVIGFLVLIVVFVLIFYGMGLFDFSFPSSADYDSPVVERVR